MTICDFSCSGPTLLKVAKKKFPNAKLFAYNSEHPIRLKLKRILEKELGNNNVNIIKEIKDNMKFDHIIMNPPYDKNLHLKILREAMKHIEKDGGEIVSLEPITELKNVTESTKEIPEIVPHIIDVIEISEEDASKLFNITLRKKLGIWHLSGDKVDTYKYNIKAKRIFDKIKGKSWRSVCQHSNENNKIYLYMQGDNGYAKGWHLTIDQIFNMPNAAENAARLLFDSENEKNNFLKSTSLNIYKYIYKLDGNAAVPAHMPFLPTYKKPWTDADLYEYFKLSKEEQKIVENEMK